MNQKMIKIRDLLTELKQHPEVDKGQVLQALAQKYQSDPQAIQILREIHGHETKMREIKQETIDTRYLSIK